MKKIFVLVMGILLAGMTVVLAAAPVTDIRTISKSERKVEIEYPFVVKGTTAANEKINNAIGGAVDALVEEGANLGGGKIAYTIQKSDVSLLSLTLVLTPKQGEEITKGLTFDRSSGAKRPLSFYYNDSELSRRSADGLQYLYDVPAAKAKTAPDEYYVDEDNNIIGVYHAGTLLKKSEGELEINLSATDPVGIGTNIEVERVTPPVYNGTDPKGTISGTDVRMRDGASLTSEVLGYFEYNEVVGITKSAVAGGRKWLRVTRANGSTGWVAADYCSANDAVSNESSTAAVSVPASKKGTITGMDVRMRSDASINADVLDYFEKGEVVTILDAASGSGREWIKVRRDNGAVGWVASEYCREST